MFSIDAVFKKKLFSPRRVESMVVEPIDVESQLYVTAVCKNISC